MNGDRTALPLTALDPQRREPLRQITMLIVENQEVIRRGLLAIVSAVPEIVARTVAGTGAEPPGPFDIALASTAVLESVEEAWAPCAICARCWSRRPRPGPSTSSQRSDARQTAT